MKPKEDRKKDRVTVSTSTLFVALIVGKRWAPVGAGYGGDKEATGGHTGVARTADNAPRQPANPGGETIRSDWKENPMPPKDKRTVRGICLVCRDYFEVEIRTADAWRFGETSRDKTCSAPCERVRFASQAIADAILCSDGRGRS